ncbi:hypothetical protein GUITHDRAFT_148855 [Guillardia theta CCMP2712]|uniref:Uncharacterized protein n=1 Tax=Guillardia theta (strain CCMP2712) TaxID=905079 RepID=L1I7L5_GUITC|nr:hypothetical protein GUITHDRAFT_148855 [Guillardia theta CCMP2712]EKX32082.1 hypothetical protein GUITHDRAFT_148855 [Guillardia theta CCMP2712]|eukprot:XP_005819062.1 hypothetical protein GUITHDRAFT_148855 [Guillardia theta CCMP2712]
MAATAGVRDSRKTEVRRKEEGEGGKGKGEGEREREATQTVDVDGRVRELLESRSEHGDIDELLRDASSMVTSLGDVDPHAVEELIRDLVNAQNPLGACIRKRVEEASGKMEGGRHGEGREEEAVRWEQVERWWSMHGEGRLRALIREELQCYTETHKKLEKRLKEASSLLRRVASVSNKVLLASSQRRASNEPKEGSLLNVSEHGTDRKLSRQEAGQGHINSTRPAGTPWVQAPTSFRLPFEISLEDIGEDSDWKLEEGRDFTPARDRIQGRKSKRRVKSADPSAARRRDAARAAEARWGSGRETGGPLSQSLTSLDSFRSAFEKELQRRMEEVRLLVALGEEGGG